MCELWSQTKWELALCLQTRTNTLDLSGPGFSHLWMEIIIPSAYACPDLSKRTLAKRAMFGTSQEPSKCWRCCLVWDCPQVTSVPCTLSSHRLTAWSPELPILFYPSTVLYVFHSNQGKLLPLFTWQSDIYPSRFSTVSTCEAFFNLLIRLKDSFGNFSPVLCTYLEKCKKYANGLKSCLSSC